MCVVVEMIPLGFPVKSQGFQTRLLNTRGERERKDDAERKNVQEGEIENVG